MWLSKNRKESELSFLLIWFKKPALTLKTHLFNKRVKAKKKFQRVSFQNQQIWIWLLGPTSAVKRWFICEGLICRTRFAVEKIPLKKAIKNFVSGVKRIVDKCQMSYPLSFLRLHIKVLALNENFSLKEC